MRYLSLGVGAAAGDGTGDTLRSGMVKVNTNFNDISTDVADLEDEVELVKMIRTAASVTHTKTSIVAGDLLKVTEVDDTGGAVGLDIAEGIGRHTEDYDCDWFCLMKIGDVNDITVTFTTGTLLGVPTIKTQYNILFVLKTGANEWTCIGGEA